MRNFARALCVCAVLVAPPALGETFTLEEALGVAYETNPVLAAQQAALRATDEGVAQANAGWRPSINAGGTYGYDEYSFTPVTIPAVGTYSKLSAHPLNGQIVLSEPLFRGGRTYAEVNRAKQLVNAGRAQLVATEQTVLLNAVTAYMDVVRDETILQLRQHNVEVLTKQRDSTQLEFKAGALTRTDVAQSEARLAGAQSDFTAAQGQLAVSRASFEQVIGRPSESLETQPVYPGLPATQDDAIARALKENPAIVSAKANERAADYAVTDALGALMPQLSVQGQYQYAQGSVTSPTGGFAGGGSSYHVGAVVGQLSVPIYQGGAEDAAVRQAKELHAQSQLNMSVADREVRQAVASAWSTFRSAQASIDSNEATVKADEIAFEGVSKEQQIGGRTVLDVLNAEQEYMNAQVALMSSRRDAVVAAYQVLAASGGLTAQGLALKVKAYDPRAHYDSDSSRWIGLGD